MAFSHLGIGIGKGFLPISPKPPHMAAYWGFVWFVFFLGGWFVTSEFKTKRVKGEGEQTLCGWNKLPIKEDTSWPFFSLSYMSHVTITFFPAQKERNWIIIDNSVSWGFRIRISHSNLLNLVPSLHLIYHVIFCLGLGWVGQIQGYHPGYQISNSDMISDIRYQEPEQLLQIRYWILNAVYQDTRSDPWYQYFYDVWFTVW